MSQMFSQSLAVCAAFILATASIGAVVTVPPAHAHAMTAIELA